MDEGLPSFTCTREMKVSGGREGEGVEGDGEKRREGG